MRLVIVGATPIGLALGRVSVDAGHDVWLVERDAERAESASQALDARVLHADIADADVAEAVEMARAAAVVAVTSDDSDNLMAMMLASEAGVATRVSIVNESSHRKMFERFQVRTLEDPEAVLAAHLYGVLLHPRARRFYPVAANEWIFEVSIGGQSALAGKTVAEIGDEGLLPAGMTLLRVYAGESSDTPRPPAAETRIESGNRLLVLTDRPVSDSEFDLFTG